MPSTSRGSSRARKPSRSARSVISSSRSCAAERRLVDVVVERQRQLGSRVLGIAGEGVERLVRHVTHGTRAAPAGQALAAVGCAQQQAVARGRRPFLLLGSAASAGRGIHRRRVDGSWQRSRSGSARAAGGPTGSTTWRSSRRGAPATRRTSRSAGRSTRSASIFRCSASAMDGVVSPRTAIEIGRLGGVGVLNLEGLWTRYADPDPILEEISHARRRHRHQADAGALRRADQARAHRRADPADQGRRRHHRRQPHPAARQAVLPGGARRGRRPVRHPGHGRQRRARLQPRRAAEPQEVHRRPRRPGHRRRLRVVLHRAAPDAHRRGRPARRRRPRPRLHHPRRARRRRADGHRDR